MKNHGVNNHRNTKRKLKKTNWKKRWLGGT